MKKVSMQTIADRLGLSKFTISQALSGKDGVGRETRQRVIEMAETLGYLVKAKHPEELQEQPEGARGTVLIAIRREFRIEYDFWVRVLEGATAACTANGWRWRIIEDSDQPLQKAKEEGEKIIGILVLGITPRQQLLLLQSSGYPMVLVDHEDPLIEADVILNANMEASRLACKQLILKGCRSLVFVGRDNAAFSFRERWWGCKVVTDEWKKAHPADSLILAKWTIPQTQTTWGSYFDKRLTAMLSGQAADGFLCANDRIAMSLMEALGKHGLKVPEQCLVIGVDNIEAAASAIPPLTTVFLAKEELGARAVEAMKRRAAHWHAIPEKIVLSAGLIVRQSG